MARQEIAKQSFTFNLSAYIDAVATGHFADRKGKSGWASLHRATDALVTRGVMKGDELKQWAFDIISAHPGTGVKGGTTANVTSNRYVSSLVKKGVLVPVKK